MAIEKIEKKEKRNGDPMKIYLDTNVIIRGGKLPGTDKLKELSRKGEIKLFISDYASLEQYKGPSEVSRRINEFLNTHKERNKDFFAGMKELRKKEHEREFRLKEEPDYWKDCKINYCKSIFGGLVAVPPPLLQFLADQFGEHIHLELSRFEQLRTKYKIKVFDAILLMEAQGSKMNWFITEDKYLLKEKTSNISWLIFKISRLEEFLRIHNWSGEK